jgi:GDP-4-dehydro-6-deoxy-D-mannose reductase
VDKPEPARILITGFTGFVGGYLVEHCQQRYPEVELFGLCKSEVAQQVSMSKKHIIPLKADILQADDVREVVAHSHPDIIFHLAAQSSVAASWTDPVQTLQVNALGTLHLLEAVRQECPTACVVLVGSAEQYGTVAPHENPISGEQTFKPGNPYAISKVTQDLYGYQYFIAYGLPIVRVRSFNHFGPHQASTFVLASFARQIALIEAGRAEPIIMVGNLQAKRDFLPVEDVVEAYLTVTERGQPGEVYNVGAGKAHSIGEMLDLLLSLAKMSIQICQDPARVRPVDIPILEADISRIRAHTGWKPTKSFEVALEEMLDYWRVVVANTI